MNEKKIGDISLFDDHEFIIVEVDGREIAVFNVNDDYHAVLNFCPHQAGPLCANGPTGRSVIREDSWEYTDEGKIVECPWHSWKFDITSGKCLTDSNYGVPTYDVAEKDGVLYLDLY